MKIDKILNDTYIQEDGIIFSPTIGSEIIYTIYVSDLNPFTVTTFKVSFINSKTGFKYKLIPSNLERLNEKSYALSFIVDQQSSEKAKIDFLDLIIEGDDFISNIKKTIKVVEVKKTTQSFKYQKGTLTNFETNLLSIRNRIGMAKWGNGYNNSFSNNAKILESLNSVFTSTYTKTNDYLKQAYSDQKLKTFSRCKLTKKPVGILREGTELIETTNLSNSLFNLNLTNTNSLEDTLIVILEKFSENKEEIKELNKYLPSYLYLKNDSSNQSKTFNCIIEGYDEFDNLIKETLIIRNDIYTRTKNKYYRIKDISNKGLSIVVSNYVDLCNNYYVDNNSFIIPSIVNKDNMTFKPNIKKRSNLEGNFNLLYIYNYLSENVTEELKFNIGLEGDYLTSAYISDNLDLIYTYIREDKNYLAYSKLYLDYSKNFYNNSINNSSSILSVSDMSTSLGDWFEVILDIEEWYRKTNDSSFILQIRNNNKIFYYDVEEKDLKTEKVINYYQNTLTPIDFSLFVENKEPYVVTVMSGDLENKITSSSSCNTIESFFEREIDINTRLILKNNNIYLAEEKVADITTNTIEDYQLIIENTNSSKLLYKLGLNDYEISTYYSTLSSSLFTYISNMEEDSLPIVLTLNSDVLKEGYLQLGFGYTKSFGVLPNTLNEIKVTLKKGVIERSITFIPTIVEEIVDKYEYKINIANIEEGFINDN